MYSCSNSTPSHPYSLFLPHTFTPSCSLFLPRTLLLPHTLTPSLPLPLSHPHSLFLPHSLLPHPSSFLPTSSSLHPYTLTPSSSSHQRKITLLTRPPQQQITSNPVAVATTAGVAGSVVGVGSAAGPTLIQTIAANPLSRYVVPRLFLNIKREEIFAQLYTCMPGGTCCSALLIVMRMKCYMHYMYM